MGKSKRVGVILVLALIVTVPVANLAQDTGAAATEGLQEAATSALDQVLTFIDSASTYVGQGVLYVLNLITKDRVSGNLAKPIGYLATITLILIVFGLVDVAKRIIWIGIIVGWALLVVRIILDAVGA